MRAFQVGPGSSASNWKATLDPGKNLPCSNSPANRTDGAGAGAGSGQQGSGDQKKWKNTEKPSLITYELLHLLVLLTSNTPIND